jgi:hypothetical protein
MHIEKEVRITFSDMSVYAFLAHPLSYRIVPIGTKAFFLFSVGRFLAEMFPLQIFLPNLVWMSGLCWMFVVSELRGFPRGLRLATDMLVVVALLTKDFFDICKVVI